MNEVCFSTLKFVQNAEKNNGNVNTRSYLSRTSLNFVFEHYIPCILKFESNTKMIKSNVLCTSTKIMVKQLL